MKLAIEKRHRKTKGGTYPKQIGERHTQGRRHIRTVFIAGKYGKPDVLRILHATKGWRERNADSLPMSY